MNPPKWPLISLAIALGSAFAGACWAADGTPQRPGIPDLQQPFSRLASIAKFSIATNADWVAVTPNSIWVAGAGPNKILRIDARTNKVVATIPLPNEACAGMVAGFGSLWVPQCGDTQSVVKIDLRTGQIIATIPFGPAEEGGITVSPDSVWFTTGDDGTLIRLNPRTNKVRQTVRIASHSYNPIFDQGTIWISSPDHNLITAVNAVSGGVLGVSQTGPWPRFLVAGGGSIWTLNQGDGSVTRINRKSRRPMATIQLGVPGRGGDIAYTPGVVWASVIGIPLTAIDVRSGNPVIQWVGPGGDALRFGHGSLWLTDYRGGTLSRIQPGRALGIPPQGGRAQ